MQIKPENPHKNNSPEEATMHGVLLEIFGIGVLIRGNSCIGKSETALELLTRGHRLVADDSVIIRRKDGSLEGDSPELTRGSLHIRGLGLIDVHKLFGDSSLGGSVRLELCIDLTQEDSVEPSEIFGSEMTKKEILGVSIDSFNLPVYAGRGLALLVETAVRTYISDFPRNEAAVELIERHLRIVGPRSVGHIH